MLNRNGSNICQCRVKRHQQIDDLLKNLVGAMVQLFQSAIGWKRPLVMGPHGPSEKSNVISNAFDALCIVCISATWAPFSTHHGGGMGAQLAPSQRRLRHRRKRDPVRTPQLLSGTSDWLDG
jgi:hypothetical protein